MPKDRLNITIRIAELQPFAIMDITPEEEEIIRTAEYNVNNLWRRWRQRYTNKSSNEVLGMVAFQFAKAFVIHSREEEAVNGMLERFEEQLDNILLDVGNPDDADQPSALQD